VEPYRLEGKKTMGYEIAEQFGWELPEAVVYPAGGGMGLIGMWKAFTEMSQLGWIEWARLLVNESSLRQNRAYSI
jgi:threonine synthase